MGHLKRRAKKKCKFVVNEKRGVKGGGEGGLFVVVGAKVGRAVQYSTVQYSTVQYSTVQYSTVQYSTVQYSTVQYSTVQYSTVQYSRLLRQEGRGEALCAHLKRKRMGEEFDMFILLR